MFPTSNLLDRKLSTYIVSPHGVTTAGDSNTFVVSKNMHVFCMTFRRQTFFQDPTPGGHDHFRGIRNVCYNYIDKKYSINQVIDKIIPDTFLTADAKSAFAYYPPGSTIRNLKLSRDWNNFTNIDGVFKIGDKYPIGVIKPNRIGQIDSSSGLPFYPPRDRVPDDKLSVDSTPANAAITQAVKRWDLDNPANIHPLNNFPRKWLKFNNLKSVFDIITENGDKEEEKIILVLSCAEAIPGPPEYSTNERMITAQNLLDGNFRSDANPDKLCAVLFQNPNFKEDICYLLENNIRFNERLHIGIEKPIHYFNPEEDLKFLYRSRKSFNSLLTQIPGRMGGVLPKYLIIKDNQINYCTRDEVLQIELPFIIIKVPDGYKKFLYSRDIDFVQFSQSFGDAGDQSLTAPVGFLQVPHIFANPTNIGRILEEAAAEQAAPAGATPAGAAPAATHSQLINEYYTKYLKYKQKYLQLKN